MAQCRVHFFEQERVVARIAAAYAGVLGVGLHVGVYDFEYAVARGEGRCLDILAQAFPVFRLEVGLDESRLEAVEVLHVVFECNGSVFGKPCVVLVAAFGRCEAFYGYGCDGDVGVGAHGVDGGGDSRQFGGVVAVVGIDGGFVDGEVDIGAFFELACLHGVGHGADVAECGLENGRHRRHGLDKHLEGVVAARHDGAAASGYVVAQPYDGVFHPRLGVDVVGIAEGAGAAVFVDCGAVEVVLADVFVVEVVAGHYDGLELAACVAVGTFDDGCDSELSVTGEAEAGDVELHAEQQAVVDERCYVFGHGGFRAGEFYHSCGRCGSSGGEQYSQYDSFHWKGVYQKT